MLENIKMPFYWLSLWDGLSDEDVGMIIKAMFKCALDQPVERWTLDTHINDVLDKCILDVEYQKTHHRSYRVPEERSAIRNSGDYRAWRATVYERDNYTCQSCGQIGGRLNAHHIKSFARHPDLRLDVRNGITLCEKCHKLAHKRGFKYA